VNLGKFVPPLLKNGLRSLRGRDDSRRIVHETKMPLRVYMNPHVWPGSRLHETGHWEPETEELLRRCLKPGDVFLDIGANEGILSAFAGTLVGPSGLVIAVEPQAALRAIIEVNLALNDVRRARVYTGAIGQSDGSRAELNLYPSTNTGQASFVHKPALGWTTLFRRTQAVTFISPERILAEAEVAQLDLVKVDTEGFEAEIVEVLLPSIRQGKVKHLLLDYHLKVLDKRGIDPATIHAALLAAGMKVTSGNGHLRGDYTLYASGTPSS
jgi:FkbM family methyltransferase